MEASPEQLTYKPATCATCGRSDELWEWYGDPTRQTIEAFLNSDGTVSYDYTGITDSGDGGGVVEGYYCGSCHTYTDTIEELVGAPIPKRPYTDTEAVTEIHKLLDGTEWSPNTAEAIAEIVRASGREIRDPDWASPDG